MVANICSLTIFNECTVAYIGLWQIYNIKYFNVFIFKLDIIICVIYSNV